MLLYVKSDEASLEGLTEETTLLPDGPFYRGFGDGYLNFEAVGDGGKEVDKLADWA